MEEKVIEKTEESLKPLLEEGITPNNVEYIYKLCKIKHMAKEDENMNYAYGNSYGNNYGNYGNYGRGYGYGEGYGAYGNSYGENYGRRGYDAKYRGEEQLGRLSGDYGRYQESRRYGDGEEKDKSFYYMIKSLEGFIKTIDEEAESPQQKSMLKETLQKNMM